ncbi:MAG: hypothetical protein Q7J78_05805 [Clostridiales bacterium]|nr:hypothetical protein [Clostridiales bacterium]
MAGDIEQVWYKEGLPRDIWIWNNCLAVTGILKQVCTSLFVPEPDFPRARWQGTQYLFLVIMYLADNCSSGIKSGFPMVDYYIAYVFEH